VTRLTFELKFFIQQLLQCNDKTMTSYLVYIHHELNKSNLVFSGNLIFALLLIVFLAFWANCNVLLYLYEFRTWSCPKPVEYTRIWPSDKFFLQHQFYCHSNIYEYAPKLFPVCRISDTNSIHHTVFVFPDQHTYVADAVMCTEATLKEACKQWSFSSWRL
jgi:hypothetical protein